MSQVVVYATLLAKGTGVTLSVAVLGLCLAIFLGFLTSLTKMSSRRTIALWGKAYTHILRGIPDIVIMLLVYFNGQLILNHLMRRLDVQMVEFSPFLAGVISIGLLFGAYLCEAFCDVRKNLPKQQIESAMALGFSPTKSFVFIILPQIIIYALPSINNIWQNILKSAVIVSVLGLSDILHIVEALGRSTGEHFLFICLGMAIFMTITALSEIFFARMTSKFSIVIN